MGISMIAEVRVMETNVSRRNFYYEKGAHKGRYILITIALIVAATLIGLIFREINFPETNIVIVYLLAILLVARFTYGFMYSVISTIIVTYALNYFFTEPYFTLRVNDPQYFITFLVMAITAIITSALTSKVKQNAVEAQKKEAETSALYKLTNRLTDATDLSDIASIATSTISSIMGCRVAFLCFDENGEPEQSFIQQQDSKNQVRRNLDNKAEIRHRMEGLRTAFDTGLEFCDWPIYGTEQILGVLRIPTEAVVKMGDSRICLLRSMIESTALAMDRFRSMQARLKSKEEMVQERYRGNLLRAISHDLRTPLSGIMGTAEILMDMTEKSDERYALAEGIHKDADWLHSLVENILSLTRLQEGKLMLHKEVEAVEEIVGSAVEHIMERAPEHQINVHIPDEPLFVAMDAKLVMQMLINLLDNAVKHTMAEEEITVTVTEDSIAKKAIFSIADQGEGISSEDLPHIFQMFYTTHGKQADSQRGVGLGLAICEAIATAHGGTIIGHNRSDRRGAEFIVTLPMEG